MRMFRIYVERKAGFQNEAARIFSEITGFLGIGGVTGVRYFNRYDIENVADEVAKASAFQEIKTKRDSPAKYSGSLLLDIISHLCTPLRHAQSI